MGVDKASLRVPGHPSLLHRQIGVARSLGPVEICLSCRPDQRRWAPPDVRAVVDDGTSGPLGGLAAVLGAARGDAVLLLGVDLACMTPLLLQQIAASAAIDGSRGAVPRTRRGIEPLAAVYPRRARPLVLERLQSRRRLSMRTLAEALHEAGLIRWHSVAPWDEFQFANLNRPTDLVLAAARRPRLCETPPR